VAAVAATKSGAERRPERAGPLGCASPGVRPPPPVFAKETSPHPCNRLHPEKGTWSAIHGSPICMKPCPPPAVCAILAVRLPPVAMVGGHPGPPFCRRSRFPTIPLTSLSVARRRGEPASCRLPGRILRPQRKTRRRRKNPAILAGCKSASCAGPGKRAVGTKGPASCRPGRGILPRTRKRALGAKWPPSWRPGHPGIGGTALRAVRVATRPSRPSG